MKLDRRQALLTTLAAAAGFAGTVLAARTPAPAHPLGLGDAVPPADVPDADGRHRTLAEFAHRIVVLEWTSPSCPFVKAQYDSGGMQALQRWSLERGIVWLSVLSTHPSRPDHLTAGQARTFNMQRGASPTALLMDDDGTLGRLFGARTTPHLFVVSADGKLVYAGAIDDRPTVDKTEVGRSRNWVKAALDDLLAGHPIGTPRTRSYGCAVGYAT
jgi:hypothetical protein